VKGGYSAVENCCSWSNRQPEQRGSRESPQAAVRSSSWSNSCQVQTASKAVVVFVGQADESAQVIVKIGVLAVITGEGDSHAILHKGLTGSQ